MPPIQLPSPSSLINCSDLSSCLQNLYNLGVAVLIALCFLYFVFGAFQYLLSGANIFSTEKAKNKMKNSIIALIVVFVIPVVLYYINPRIFNTTVKVPQVKAILPAFQFYMPEGTMINGSQIKGTIPIKEICQIVIDVANKNKDADRPPPALLLAILKVETDFAKNQGNCSYDDLTNKRNNCKWNTGEQHCFDEISENMNISKSNVRFNRIGAMGPAQFMPCTWKNERHEGNPWDLRDALTAMSKKLGNGTDIKICEYHAGKYCYNSSTEGYQQGMHYVNKVNGYKNFYQNNYLKDGKCPDTDQAGQG